MGRGRGETLEGATGLLDFDFDDIDRFGFTDAFSDLTDLDEARANPQRLIRLLNAPLSQAAVDPVYNFVVAGGLRGIVENFLSLKQSRADWEKLIRTAKELLFYADLDWQKDLESPLLKNRYYALRQTIRTLEKAANAQLEIPLQQVKLDRNPEARSHDGERMIVKKMKEEQKKAEEAIKRDENYEILLDSLEPQIAAALREARRKSQTGETYAHRYEAKWADIAYNAHRYTNFFPEQIEMIKRHMGFLADQEMARADREALLENAPPLEEGKYQFEGVYHYAKPKRNDFNGDLVSKMVVQLDNGNRIWGTMPKKFEEEGELEKGCRVRMTATVKRSDNDPHFGFFSRPTKPEKL
jgi:hypothetical protein